MHHDRRALHSVLTVIAAGNDDGVPGPLEFIYAVEPSTVSIPILEFDETGTWWLARSDHALNR